MKFRTALLGLALSWVYLCASAVIAQESGLGPERDGAAVVKARLMVDADAVALGQPFRIGVLFEMAPGWHIYWRHPGDAGLPTELGWKTPDLKTGPLRWPAPKAFEEGDGELITFGYSDEVLLAQEATITSAGPAANEIALALDADFLTCKVECIPGRISLARRIPLEAKARVSTEAAKLFAVWEQAIPSSPTAHGLTVDAHFSQDRLRPGDSFRAAISLVCEGDARCKGLRSAADSATGIFIPDKLDEVDLRVTGTRRHPFAEGLLITLEGEAEADAFVDARALRGVVLLQSASGKIPTEIHLEIPVAVAGAAVQAVENPWLEPDAAQGAATGVSFWHAFLLAMLGGLILNLMPCVLPVLAIKVFGIAERAHAARREVLLQGGAYTAGILATMMALALVVIGLREAGTAVGWGFQFQEPIFVAAISALLTVFALNLFGVFEIGAPSADAVADAAAGASGFRGSFFEGILAVLLATPCSAPFLGTAVGFAFASPAPVILGIFAAVGLGLAAPFVLITWIPGWARLLPRSGAWMEKLRGVLGFALLATLVWLLWVVGRSVGTDGMSLLLGFLVLLSLGVWLYGLRQRASDEGRAPVFALVLAGLTIAALVTLPLEPQASQTRSAEDNTLAASAFSPEAVTAKVQAGQPVFVYFTADWCLTCKVNERAVLQNERVGAALEQQGVVAFKADWTRRDEGIRLELARFGRAGVPMYLLYDPRRPDEPKVLPELLTVELLLEAIEELR